MDLAGRLAALVIAASLAAACSKQSTGELKAKDGNNVGTTVKLALNWIPEPEFGGFYAAREGGAYRRQGLDVEILGGGAGVPVVQMVATGQADFGTVGGDELVIARARGADVVAVFATFQTSPQGIMAHASRGLTTLSQVFQSGTIAIEPGLPYASYLRKLFPWEGVRVVPYDGGVARFLADPAFAQQCFVTSEPIVARMRGAEPRVFLVADTGFNPYGTVVIARRDLVSHKPEMVGAFVTATTEGWRAYLTDPRATHELLFRLNPSMDAATLALCAEAQKPLVEPAATKLEGLGAMNEDRWRVLTEQLTELGVIDRPSPPAELFVRLGPR